MSKKTIGNHSTMKKSNIPYKLGVPKINKKHLAGKKRVNKVLLNNNFYAPTKTKSRELDLEKLKKVYNIGQEKPIPSSFTPDQLLEALYWMYDVMDRALITMCLVGTTADCVIKNIDLGGEGITVAIRKLERDSGSWAIATTFAPPLEDLGDKVKYRHINGVPVTVYVLKDSVTLQQPNVVLYRAEGFKIPSPYDQFLKEFPFLA